MDVLEHKQGADARAATDQRGSRSSRARVLIERERMHCMTWMVEPLRACIGHFEQQLFALADHARDPFNQQRHFSSRQRLLQERGRFEQAFLDDMGAAFDRLGVPAAAPPPAPAHLTLSLLDTAEQDLASALDELASRGEKQCGPLLGELGLRLAVLVGAPPLEDDELPPGPRGIARAVRHAYATVGLPDEYELLLLKSLQPTVLREIPRLYRQINQRLVDDGVLPVLRPLLLGRASPAVATRSTAVDPPERGPPRFEPQADSFQPSGPQPERSAAGRGNESIAVLDSLRELLGRRRSSSAGADESAGAAESVATSDELQLALNALQQHLTEVTDQASRELRSAQRLREELLTQLNADKPGEARRTRLSPQQGDTVELVAMLFEQLSQQLHHGEGARQVLGGLQVPMLRMAVSDQNFFEQREHPARQLLGTVTEAAHDWLDDSGSDADRSLRGKLEQLVDRASREAPSAGLYTSLLADIQQHLTLLSRKAEATERRHVEAMQGRERLEQARLRASELMAERFAKHPPRGLLRALLDRAWSDVLALTLLRHGESSDAFVNQLDVTDQLLGNKSISDTAQLQQDVQTGLQQIGMHHEEAAQVAQRLVLPGTVAPSQTGVDTLSTTDLAMRLKQHQRLGEKPSAAPAPASTRAPTRAAPGVSSARSSARGKAVAGASAGSAPPAAATKLIKPAPGPRELKLQEQLRLMPFGSWFEFADSRTGKIVQRKLAWYSPVSGHALFVNRRGQRGDEVTLAQLAHEMAQGRVTQVPEVSESPLDRAWKKLTGSLMRPSSAYVSRSREVRG